MRAAMLRSLVIALIVFVAAPALAGTIVRSTKPSAGTDWQDGDVLTKAGLNGDENTIYNEFNGNIENVNVKSTAAIKPSKLDQTPAAGVDAATDGMDADIVDDFSKSDAEHLSQTTPGTSDALGTVPTNIQEEIGDLRGAIERIAIGQSCSEVNAGGATAASCNWIDGPVQGPNLVYNGGFDSLNTLAVGTSGDGWTEVLTPTTLAGIDINDGFGDGQALNIIDTGAALAGVSQTLDGLRADTRYLALVDTKDQVGKCQISTTGADTNQMLVQSDDSNTWQTIGGVFETDSTPTDVVLILLAVAQSDDCIFNNVRVYQLGNDPVSYGGPIAIFKSDNTEDEVPDGSGAKAAVSNLPTITITPPGPGWTIIVDASISAGDDTDGTTSSLICNLDDGSDVTGTTHSTNITNVNNSSNQSSGTTHISYATSNPTPGTAITYTVECYEEAPSNFDLRYNDQGLESSIRVVMYPPS